MSTTKVTDALRNVTAVDAAKLTGSVDVARLPSTVLNSNVDLTTLSASNLTSGTLPNARLSAVPTSSLTGAVTSIASHGLGALASLATVGTTQIDNDSVTGAKLNPALVAGDIIYADGTDTINRLAKPASPAGEVLTFATSATAPSWVAAGGGGKILQVLHAQSTALITASGATWTTAVSLAITPSATSSKILIIGNCPCSHSATMNSVLMRFYRDSTVVGSGTGTVDCLSSEDVGASWTLPTISGNYLDSPSSTSAVTYYVKVASGQSTLNINQSNATAASFLSGDAHATSNITLMEIGA
jgi:hypothetical protein